MANSEIRTGRISSVNYETGMARVTYRDKDDTVTDEFPIITNNDEYRMPKVGQDVLVAHLSNGSSRGAIIGTLWNKKYSPNETGAELYRKDLSREKDAAYIRYSDETGEYLVKVANLHLNGVHKTVLDGPMLEIGANISVLLQSDMLHVDLSELLVTGNETDTIDAQIQADVEVSQIENSLKAIIMKAAIELVENLEIKSGTDIRVEAGEKVELSSGGSLTLSDDTYSVTLTEIMERLEALGG
ncbi:MAG: hypothetical protein HDR71_15340 [Lachnospiraceae bacterium]|nr:hypothetical protein [Lachnospiraceae bacterium]